MVIERLSGICGTFDGGGIRIGGGKFGVEVLVEAKAVVPAVEGIWV